MADQPYILPDTPVNVCVPVLASLCLVTRIEKHVTPADGLYLFLDPSLYLFIDPCLSTISLCVRVFFFALVCLSSHTKDPYNMDQPVREIDCELTFVERVANSNPTGDRGQLVQPQVLLSPVVPHPVPEQRPVGPPV